ncbi:MAG: DUF1573 domain-containing protein [Flavobacterium sp.]|uniref:DUF1573 domain-containing protein n=1 Tax=Flavobacterium sp. TaxID=239 RepID=UPI001207926E|nr:DUF1573 domain-containing protein [Flavobacterium sp.]RZJ64394.1 MAG: DUF1573 domain-containing protein [Flavobacterium sp.]
MIKKFVFAFAACAVIAATSCKKEDATSKIDPNATDVPVSTTEPNPEANIGGPEVTQTPAPAPVDGKYPVMSFETSEHDFGTIKQGDKVQYVFKFKNAGEADLIISKAVGSCGCTVPEFPKEPIKPGASGEMKVSFNSTGKHGKQTKSVTITANTKNGTEKLEIHASVEEKAS